MGTTIALRWSSAVAQRAKAGKRAAPALLQQLEEPGDGGKLGDPESEIPADGTLDFTNQVSSLGLKFELKPMESVE